jgi:hypothetical protein
MHDYSRISDFLADPAQRSGKGDFPAGLIINQHSFITAGKAPLYT